MVYMPAIVGLVIVFGLAVFFWRRNGAGSGRSLGNRVATHTRIPRKVFYILLDNGAKGPSRELLASLEKSGMSLDDASIELGPSLKRGIERLEARFGPQEMYDQAKPIVAALVARHEAKT